MSPPRELSKLTGMAQRLEEEMLVALSAVTYFTRLPVWTHRAHQPHRLTACIRYFPLVGALVGLTGAGVFWLTSHVLPVPVALLLSMMTTLIATGALHEDGFADCCDAFGAGFNREARLRIMKDPRLGTYGVTGIGMMLLLKWQTLTALSSHSIDLAAGWMIVAHAASRAGATVFLMTLPPARSPKQDSHPAGAGDSHTNMGGVGEPRSAGPSSKSSAAGLSAPLSATAPLPGAPLKHLSAASKSDAFRSPSKSAVAVALLTGLPALWWQGMTLGITLLAIGTVLYLALARLWRKALGGYTGDCLGMAQQIFEITIYLLGAAWIWS